MYRQFIAVQHHDPASLISIVIIFTILWRTRSKHDVMKTAETVYCSFKHQAISHGMNTKQAMTYCSEYAFFWLPQILNVSWAKQNGAQCIKVTDILFSQALAISSPRQRLPTPRRSPDNNIAERCWSCTINIQLTSNNEFLPSSHKYFVSMSRVLIRWL
jgi:hypothetical protein